MHKTQKPEYIGWLYQECSSLQWIGILGYSSNPTFQIKNPNLELVIAALDAEVGRKIQLQEIMNINLGLRIY